MNKIEHWSVSIPTNITAKGNEVVVVYQDRIAGKLASTVETVEADRFLDLITKDNKNDSYFRILEVYFPNWESLKNAATINPRLKRLYNFKGRQWRCCYDDSTLLFDIYIELRVNN